MTRSRLIISTPDRALWLRSLISGARRKLSCPRCSKPKTAAITLSVSKSAIITSTREKPPSLLAKRLQTRFIEHLHLRVWGSRLPFAWIQVVGDRQLREQFFRKLGEKEWDK